MSLHGGRPGLLALFSYGFSNYYFAIYGDGKNQSRKGTFSKNPWKTKKHLKKEFIEIKTGGRGKGRQKTGDRRKQKAERHFFTAKNAKEHEERQKHLRIKIFKI